jgi:hypothetical protein
MFGLQVDLKGHSLPFPLLEKQPLTMFSKAFIMMKLMLQLFWVMSQNNIVGTIQCLEVSF